MGNAAGCGPPRAATVTEGRGDQCGQVSEPADPKWQMDSNHKPLKFVLGIPSIHKCDKWYRSKKKKTPRIEI